MGAITEHLYLQTWRRVEALHDLGVVEEAVGAVADGHHPPAAAVDVDAVHVAEGQADVGGRLGQDGEALVCRVGPLGQAQHGHRGQLVDGVEGALGVGQNLQRGRGRERERALRKSDHSEDLLSSLSRPKDGSDQLVFLGFRAQEECDTMKLSVQNTVPVTSSEPEAGKTKEPKIWQRLKNY